MNSDSNNTTTINNNNNTTIFATVLIFSFLHVCVFTHPHVIWVCVVCNMVWIRCSWCISSCLLLSFWNCLLSYSQFLGASSLLLVFTYPLMKRLTFWVMYLTFVSMEFSLVNLISCSIQLTWFIYQLLLCWCSLKPTLV